MKTFYLRDKETEQIYGDVVEFDDSTALVHFRATADRQGYLVNYASVQRIKEMYEKTADLVSTD